MNNCIKEKGVKKKGQVSAFIIISVLIVVIVIGYLYLNSESLNFDNEIHPDIRSEYNFLQGCMNKLGEDSVYVISHSGGYFSAFEPALDRSVAYYLYEDKNYMPSKERIEDELSFYMNLFIPFCLNDLEENSEFIVNEIDDVETKASIEDNDVIFDIKYKMRLVKGENTYDLRNFKTSIPVRLGNSYNAVSEAMIEQMKYKDSVCVNCLYDIGEKYKVKFHVLETNETNSLLFVVSDENSKLFGEDFNFYYANKLSLKEI